MKIGIVIPLRAKSTTPCWDALCLRLQGTINSLERQTSRNFQCLIVGHDRPEFLEENHYKKLTDTGFQEYAESSPPEPGKDLPETYQRYESDRCKKILKGMMALAHDPKITHWFALDGDDLMHPSFISELGKYPETRAFLIQRGYSYFHNENILIKENEFSAYCGSCSILARSLVTLPTTFNPDSYRTTLFGSVPHNKMLGYLQSNRIEVLIPQKRLMLYYRNHGGNLSEMRSHESLIKKCKFFLKATLKKPSNLSQVKQDFQL